MVFAPSVWLFFVPLLAGFLWLVHAGRCAPRRIYDTTFLCALQVFSAKKLRKVKKCFVLFVMAFFRPLSRFVFAGIKVYPRGLHAFVGRLNARQRPRRFCARRRARFRGHPAPPFFASPAVARFKAVFSTLPARRDIMRAYRPYSPAGVFRGLSRSFGGMRGAAVGGHVGRNIARAYRRY